jgi:hypothetical protein
VAKENEETFLDKLKKYFDRLREGDSVEKMGRFWTFKTELLAGILMLVGIVLSFFYPRIGGVFIGFAGGLCFYKEIYRYFSFLTHYYPREGLFKTLMMIALAVYLLFMLPTFIIALVIGFALMLIVARK